VGDEMQPNDMIEMAMKKYLENQQNSDAFVQNKYFGRTREKRNDA
jgi:hypothetical protein